MRKVRKEDKEEGCEEEESSEEEEEEVVLQDEDPDLEADPMPVKKKSGKSKKTTGCCRGKEIRTDRSR